MVRKVWTTDKKSRDGCERQRGEMGRSCCGLPTGACRTLKCKILRESAAPSQFFVLWLDFVANGSIRCSLFLACRYMCLLMLCLVLITDRPADKQYSAIPSPSGDIIFHLAPSVDGLTITRYLDDAGSLLQTAQIST
jgi:hypothetical protein